MGFFSYICHHCDHPLLCAPATTKDVNEWMSKAVVIAPDGDFHAGDYDGYGHVGGSECYEWEGGTVYHRACWEVSGKSLDFQGESDGAQDQGWFFADGEHDLPDPRSMSPSDFEMARTNLIFRLEQEEQERSDEEFGMNEEDDDAEEALI